MQSRHEHRQGAGWQLALSEMWETMDLKEDEFAHLKFRLPGIKTLAMLKMEKNFIAFVEKKYPRQPYDDKEQTISFLVDRIGDELLELQQAWLNDDISRMREECADISNLVDYLFEKLARQPENA